MCEHDRFYSQFQEDKRIIFFFNLPLPRGAHRFVAQMRETQKWAKLTIKTLVFNRLSFITFEKIQFSVFTLQTSRDRGQSIVSNDIIHFQWAPFEAYHIANPMKLQ